MPHFNLISWYDKPMDTQSSSQKIYLNSRVLVELVDTSGQSERGEFMLVTTEQADFKSGLLDENTPLGRTLLGHHAGEVVPYRMGDLKAAAQSEITNQMIFSTASGSKWGEYDVDVDKLLNDQNKDQNKDEKNDQDKT
jgi:Transcription elongation factor, GreA/GreB, C-term